MVIWMEGRRRGRGGEGKRRRERGSGGEGGTRQEGMENGKRRGGETRRGEVR